MKFYRGGSAAARHYVECGHSRVDDYYLAEGTGVAERFVATPDGVVPVGSLEGDAYEAWVSGRDPVTGKPRGRLSKAPNANRYVEVVVNAPKSWSLAAALHRDVSDALNGAMDRGAAQIIGWLAQHATTRVGPRGRQVQVPVELIEAVTVRHYTSRAADPHRHLHLQVNARVFAQGKWRGLDTLGVRYSIDAINGIGHAAMMTDPEFRRVLDRHGFSLDPESGEIRELAAFTGPFSARSRQIGRNIRRYEAEWRRAHPDEEPGPRLQRSWDARAWAEQRPDKVVPRDGKGLNEAWVHQLQILGYQPPRSPATEPATSLPGVVDRDAAVETILSRLGARRSAWNAADVRGEAERLIARSGVVTGAAARLEMAEDLTARVVAACRPLIDQDGLPEHIRSLSSHEVMAVEDDLTDRLAARANTEYPRPVFATPLDVDAPRLDEAQTRVVAGLVGAHELVVVEGAAGAGKTTTLAATRALLDERGERLIVVTPTKKAARVAGRQTGAEAFSAAWLAYQHGFRWDDDGRWTRVPATLGPEAELGKDDLLLVDEAGMLDQDTARALLAIADAHGARIAFMGDRHQLPAVGRGGVLDLAARWADPAAHLSLDTVHRFSDPEYANLSLAMRTGTDPEAVFDRLIERGHIVGHATEDARTDHIADLAAATGALVVTDTRDQVADLNHAIQERRIAHGEVRSERGEAVHLPHHDLTAGLTAALTAALTTRGGEQLGVGDRVATRLNDRNLGVANRDTWTVTGIDPDGSVRVAGEQGTRVLPRWYAERCVELAYATTAYGAQGETTDTAHVVIGEHTGASSAYVGMTRGRDSNTAHLVAETVDDARSQWVETFARDRADLGPAHAAQLAAEEASNYAARAEARRQLRPRPALTPPVHNPRAGHDQWLHDRATTRPSRSGPSIGF